MENIIEEEFSTKEKIQARGRYRCVVLREDVVDWLLDGNSTEDTDLYEDSLGTELSLYPQKVDGKRALIIVPESEKNKEDSSQSNPFNQ